MNNLFIKWSSFTLSPRVGLMGKKPNSTKFWTHLDIDENEMDESLCYELYRHACKLLRETEREKKDKGRMKPGGMY